METVQSLSASERAPRVDLQDVLELGDALNLDDFQVVRREFFAHTREPAVSLNNCKFSVNAACLAKFPETNWVQVLVNKKTKILALRPCSENTKDAFLWCNTTNGKRKARVATCKIFFAMIMTMMDWNPQHRYKLLGRAAHANGEYLLVFDLSAPEMYQRTFVEGEKPKTSRTAIYPAHWKEQFGLPFSEHKQSMQINIFDGYAVYAIKDSADTPQTLSVQATEGGSGNV